MTMLTILLACNLDSGPLLPASPPSEPEPEPVSEPAPPSRSLELLEGSDAVAAADLDGDGFDELILVDEFDIYVNDDLVGTLRGSVQHVSRGDIDGDGDEEAIITAGAGRADRDAPAQIWAVHLDGAEKLWERTGERAQISDIHVVDGRIFFATFADSRTVESGWLTDGQLEVVATAKL